MGSSETDTPTKAAKATAAQEPPPPPPPVVTGSTPVPAVYPDWSGFQAYSPIPPHGFFHSPVATSPQAHPYMWGAQHMMPPYGTPPHPYVMYPPGGLYAHPSIPPGSHPFSPYAIPVPNGIAEASGASAGAVEVDGKSSEGKERSPIKRSKGSLGSLNMITGKTNNDLGKPSGASANGAYSQSGESGSDGSSESDEHSQNDSQPKRGDGHDSYDETTQNGNTARASQNGLDRTPSQVMLSQTMPAGAPGGVAGPTTNLNIGMDYWGTSSPAVLPVHGKVPSNVVVGTVIPSGIPVSREHMPSDLWVQDEREIKRQRRKQSNRESARRSRLRKQAECEELAQRVETLKDENTSLRAELERIRKEYDQVLAQNATLKERLDGTSRGAFDTRSGKNYPPSDDDTQKNMNSDGQAGQEDANHIRTIPGHNPD